MNNPGLLVLLILIASGPSNAGSNNLGSKIADLWHGTDSQRIQFVRWVNVEQPFFQLSKAEVQALLGAPDQEYENQETPYNGQSAAAPESKQAVMWEYQTIRPGTVESEEWSGEGSGYLMDLQIHFGIDGLVYGCGTTQFVTGGDYYEMLESKLEYLRR